MDRNKRKTALWQQQDKEEHNPSLTGKNIFHKYSGCFL